MNLTVKELTALEEQLTEEKLLVKKYQTYARECSDAELKAKCNQIADKHRQHFNTLLGYLQ